MASAVHSRMLTSAVGPPRLLASASEPPLTPAAQASIPFHTPGNRGLRTPRPCRCKGPMPHPRSAWRCTFALIVGLRLGSRHLPAERQTLRLGPSAPPLPAALGQSLRPAGGIPQSTCLSRLGHQASNNNVIESFSLEPEHPPLPPRFLFTLAARRLSTAFRAHHTASACFSTQPCPLGSAVLAHPLSVFFDMHESLANLLGPGPSDLELALLKLAAVALSPPRLMSKQATRGLSGQ